MCYTIIMALQDKLTKKELKEPLMITWGRIVTRAKNHGSDVRLQNLIGKLNQDFKRAKIEENYFDA